MEHDLPLPVFSRRVYTVSELTAEIKELLEVSFEYLWIEGEASNVHLHSSGHLYLTLKDDQSQIRTVMFRSQARQLAFEPEDGMHLLCHGRLGVYEVRGEYQLILDSMEPLGLGALQRAFEQLKTRLQGEGLFDPERKRAMPFLPRRIGVVTSPTGAALRDILQILDRRFPDLHIFIRPVRVQGEGAAQEIAEALDDLNQWPGLDLIVVARGGGSLEDLWAFNEEAVARAIARSQIPVISGVGHEVDFTIADFVADARAPTPSAAAELIVPLRSDLEETLQRARDDLTRFMGRVIRDRRDGVAGWAARLQDPRRRLADRRLYLDDLHGRLSGTMRRLGSRARDQLEHQATRLIAFDPHKRIQSARQDLVASLNRLLEAMGTSIRIRKTGLEREVALLHSLSPLNVLGRGFSITRRLPTAEIVRDARCVSLGDRLRITFHRGEATCRVEGIHAGRRKWRRKA